METMGNGTVALERDGQRLDIVLSRPEKRNAIDRDVIADLREAIDVAGDDDGVRAMALLGEGPVFCGGMDLEMMYEYDRSEHEVLHEELRGVFDALEAMPKPVVVGIKRAAIAGGFELTLPADFRIMGAEAKYGLPEVKLGVFPSNGPTQRLPRLIGLAKAKELVLTGEYVDPEEAEACNLVTEVCEPGTVDERTREFADDLTDHAPLAMERASMSFGYAFDLPLSEGLDKETELSIDLYETHDRKEGMLARLEDRDPEFERR